MPFYISLCPFSALGQNRLEQPTAIDDSKNLGLSQFQIDYPIGVNGETFINGGIDYRISKSLGLRIQNFYSQFGTKEQINSSLLFKWYFKEKIYLFAGAENEYGTDQFSGERELLRVNLNLGVGYEVDEDVLLEMGYHPEVGSPKQDLLGRPIPRKSTLSLRARF
ncbi:MAG: hypothetical protein AAGC43_04940 [Bacteroidota bacterium]